MKKTLLLLMVATVGAFGQDSNPAPTKFFGHVVNATLDQWLADSHMDQAEICGPHDRHNKRMDFKQVCAVIRLIRSGQRGSLTTPDRVEWFFEGGKVIEAMIINGLFATTTDEQIALLTEVYGKPTWVDAVGHFNLAGAKWTTADIFWKLPDGVWLRAVENISGGTRELYIDATAKDQVIAQMTKQKNEPNPYK